MFSNKTDENKFHRRMQSLDNNLTSLKNISDINLDVFYEHHNIMLSIAPSIIDAKEEALKNNTDFSFMNFEEELSIFNQASSTIRRTGVELVDDITFELAEKTKYNLIKIKRVYTSLLLAGLICIILIVTLIMRRSIELKQSKRISFQLDKLSNTDELTGIGNRRSFDNTFVNEWQRSIRDKKAIALMMIDIDFFKLYNDNYGHLIGDDSLRKVAQALDTCIKRPADSVWRYGGEEFIAILPSTDDAFFVAENCRKAIEKLNIPHATSSVRNIITVSIGVCICVPDQNSDAKQFIDNVDKALYQAKNSGRNKVCIYTKETN
jgi:diguanylate cyclase (GGDEF)-like protein